MLFSVVKSFCSLTQTSVESCVDFEAANLSVLVVRRLPYPEIPTSNKLVWSEMSLVPRPS